MMQIDPALRALADLTRLRIMRLLATMELAVGECAAVLGQSQPRVSRHIRILCDAGLATRRKEGSWVFLRSAIAEGAIGEGDAGLGHGTLGGALARMLAAAEAEDAGFAAACAQDRRHLAEIRAAREAAAAAYFATHAVAWDQIRALHSPDAPVEAALLAALLGQSPADPLAKPLGRVLDIGTGTGRMAELLAPYAAHVTGLDKSPEMLRIARARLQHLASGGVALVPQLIQGDFLALPFAPASQDMVLFHQVLHYAQDPQAVLAEAARVTRPGGRIVVVDFAAHRLEELRERHAHARLGFADDQMRALFAGAGCHLAPPLALAGLSPAQPLTVKIWLGERAGAAPLAPATLPSTASPFTARAPI